MPPHERQLCRGSLAFLIRPTVAIKHAPQLPRRTTISLDGALWGILQDAVMLMFSNAHIGVMPTLCFMPEIYARSCIDLGGCCGSLDLGIVSHMSWA